MGQHAARVQFGPNQGLQLKNHEWLLVWFQMGSQGLRPQGSVRFKLKSNLHKDLEKKEKNSM